MNVPTCKQHGPMVLRPEARTTAEQRWCGVWWDCQHPHCWNSAVEFSVELATLTKARGLDR